MPTYLSRVYYTGDGATATYSVPFQYLSKTHVHAYVDGVEDTSISWPTDSSVTLSSTPANGAVVLIKRETPDSARLVDFQDSSNLTEAALDESADQVFYLQQEVLDDLIDIMSRESGGNWDADNKRIINVADPVDDGDAVNLGWASAYRDDAVSAAAAAASSETNAATSEANAASSESHASGYAAAAQSSEVEAEHWAQYPQGTLVPEGNGVNEYSAYHWAKTAEDYVFGSASGVWGTITGTVADQIDLMQHLGLGTVPHWNMSVSGGTAEEPTQILYTSTIDSNNQLKKTLTWSSGLVSTIQYETTTDGGSAWTTLGTVTYTYDVDDNVTGASWS